MELGSCVIHDRIASTADSMDLYFQRSNSLVDGTGGRSAVEAGLALNPSFTISRARALWPAISDNPTYLAGERILEALRKAGVPE